MGSTTGTPGSPNNTVIGHSAADKAVLFGGLPVAGLVLGFFLPRIAHWAGGHEWVPFQGPLRLIAAWDSWWVVAICVAVGLVAGVVLAAMALDDTLRITISNRSVEFLKHQKTVAVPREKVSVAFLEGKEIVLQDASSRELAREKHDQFKSETPKIAAAFRAHGYPWSEAGDPHEADFRRWIEDDPDLPPAVNAILKVRSKAFDDGDKGKADLRELRDELTHLGYTVKDKDKKQYWRV
ncbi:YqeB family protein [Kribbella sp. WER1]